MPDGYNQERNREATFAFCASRVNRPAWPDSTALMAETNLG
jgi:hypothetical protein